MELNAAERAAAIERAARDLATTIRAEAEQEGREAGRAQAALELARAAAVRAEAIEASRQALVPLASDIARRIVEHELTVRPERIVDIASAAIARVVRARSVMIRVHPEDAPALEALGDLAGELARRSGGVLSRCDIERDASLSRGDVVVRSAIGEVDARVETKLAAFRAALERA